MSRIYRKAPDDEQQNTEPDKSKYPFGESEQPIGQWIQPKPGYIEKPIGQSQPD